MSNLITDIKTAKRNAAENVILVDLRKKGLVKGNPILKLVNGQEMATAKANWLSSEVGRSCLQPEILYNPDAGLKYLKERLEAAFLAGAEAQSNYLFKGIK